MKKIILFLLTVMWLAVTPAYAVDKIFLSSSDELAAGTGITIGQTGGVVTISGTGGDVTGPAGGVADGDVTGFDGETGKIIKKITSIGSVSVDLGTAVASGHAVTMDANGVLQTAFTALLPDANDGATLGSSSYAWSDLYLADGAKIFVAAEDLTLTATSTTLITISSGTGITDLSFTGLNLVTTGTISGAIPSTTDNNGQTLTAPLQYGYMHWATGAGTTNLVTAVAGMNLCVYSTTAAAVVINPADADVITLNGLALTAGDGITSASGAGDFICLVSQSAGNWVTMGRSGTWTDSN